MVWFGLLFFLFECCQYFDHEQDHRLSRENERKHGRANVVMYPVGLTQFSDVEKVVQIM